MWNQKKCTLLLVPILLLITIWIFLSYKSIQNVSILSSDTSKDELERVPLEKSVGSEAKCGKNCDREFRDLFSSLTSSYRHCLLERLNGKSIWTELDPTISICIGDLLWKRLDVKKLENVNDVKTVILPPSDILATGDFANCTEVTLGIGNDIEAELQLKKVQPHCKFYGADPMEKYGTIFRKLGPFFHLAVAAKEGVIHATVLENAEKNKYVEKNVSAVSLVDFLIKHAKVTRVDYLFIDIEWSEHQLFQQFLKGGLVEANNIVVCQISVEMHKPRKDFGVTEEGYGKLVTGLVSDSSFLPIWSEKSHLGHTRSFYVNVRDPYCVGKYFRSKWCGDFQYYKDKLE